MKEKIVAIAGIVFFILFFMNLVTMVFFYKQYNDKINALNQDHWLTKVKIENMEKDAEAFKNTVDVWNGQFKKFDQTMANLEKRVISSETSVTDMSAKFSGLQDWQSRYSASVEAINDIKGKLGIIEVDVDQLKKSAIGSVNLGKIAVKGAADAQAETRKD